MFRFKLFSVRHDRSTMKVGTDAVLLGAWVQINHVKRILDIGTGSGVIALMIAQRTTDDALIDAIDHAEDDLAEARENFLSSLWSERLRAHLATVQQFSPPYQYDLIVCNPPYFSNSLEPPDDKRKSVRHTLDLSFDDLLESTLRLLTPTGTANFILPAKEGESFISLAASRKLYCTRKTSFQSKRHKPVERLLLEFSKKTQSPYESTLVLYDEQNLPSTEYRSLTGDFYLNF